MGLGDELKFKYEPILEEAPLDMDFHYYEKNEEGEEVLKIYMDNYKLISSLEEFEEFASTCGDKKIAFDTETTGLTYGKDNIVGFSLALDRYSGIYVPIRHKIKCVEKIKVEKRDENGNVVLTKTGKASMKTVENITLYECPENLDPKKALDILYRILISAKRVIMHNSIFDLNMLKFEGYDVNKINSFDTLILPYLFDPEATGLAGLKALEKRVLGRIVPEFKDVLGKDNDNFAFVKPSDGYAYACFDVSGLMGVYEELFPKVVELLKNHENTVKIDGKTYNVLKEDNNLVKAFVDYYGHAKILIDRERAKEYKKQLEDRQREVIKNIYQYFDAGMFDLSPSSNEFKSVMASKKVFTGETTNKGKPSWSTPAMMEMERNIGRLKICLDNKAKFIFTEGNLSKDFDGFTLAKIILKFGDGYFNMKDSKNELSLKGPNNERVDLALFWATLEKMYKDEIGKLNILKLVQENNSLNKALNSYVTKLTEVDECYMNYRLKGTKSGRLSSGNGSKSDKRKNNYYIDLNAQNLTKPASAYYKAEECDPSDPESILGWKFTYLDKNYAMEHLEDLYIVEGQDPSITIRGCLKAPEGSIEFSYLPNENGSEEKSIIEVEFQDGKIIKCCGDTIFKVEHMGIHTFMKMSDIIKCKDIKVLSHKGILGITRFTLLGMGKATLLEKGKHDLNGWFPIYSGGRMGARYVVSLDYDAEEYLVSCILSGDEYSKSMFLRGIDPHTATAYAIWGEENYDKSKRKKAKIFNFGNMYGGGASTLARNLDIPVKEAQEIIDDYNRAFWQTNEWKLSEIEKMYRNNGIVFNAFGRPRQFSGWLKAIDKNNERVYNGEYSNLLEMQNILESSRKVKAAIERRVASHAIQGCLQGNTRILTNHGYFKIKDLYDMCQNLELDDTWKVYTGTKWSDFTVLYMGKSRKAKLLTKNGASLNCDDRHELFYHDKSTKGFAEAEVNHKKLIDMNNDKYDLCTLLPQEFDFEPVLPKKWTTEGRMDFKGEMSINEEDHEKLWYWIGYSYGADPVKFEDQYKDSTGRRKNVIFAFNYEELTTRVMDCINFFRSFGLSLRLQILGKEENNEKGVRIIVRSIPFTYYMTQLMGMGMYDKGVPEALFKSPLAHRLAFINGLNDFNGSKGEVHSENYGFLDDLRLICSISGIPSKLMLPKRGKEVTLFLGGKYKGIKMSKIVGKSNRNSNYSFEPFSKLSVSDEVVDTYTLSVFDDEHSFVSDDFISKNCCGDILRHDLLKLYKRFFKDRDPHIDFLSTVHDEINYTIDKSFTTKYVKELEEIMTFTDLNETNKLLPIKTSTDIGFTYGNMFPFVWEDETKQKLIPKRIHHA